MKNIFTILFVLAGFLFGTAQNVEFDDNNFKSYLLNNPLINTNGDNAIQLTEAEAFTGTINCSNRNIKSLKGIEKFTNITELICSRNNLTHVFFPENKKLVKLDCSYNSSLGYIDITENVNLIELAITSTNLDYLDFSNNILLKNLYINFNSNLTYLDISKNVNLEKLFCFGNQLNGIDINQHALLKSLNIGDNNLTSINLSKNKDLEELYLGNTLLTNLDLSENKKLKILDIFDNPLITSLDVSNNIELIDFGCARNAITHLDVNNLTLLQFFYCHENQLDHLNVSHNTQLTEFSCFGNQITNLDVSKNPLLTLFSCRDNQLNTLNMKNSNNSIINIFRATNNPNLSCIQVDDVDFANSQSDWLKDDTATYNVDCLLSLNENDKNILKIFPNPVKEIINFTQVVSNIKIYDISGKLVSNFVDNRKLIDVSNLSKGVYFISLTLKSGKNISQKFVKE